MGHLQENGFDLDVQNVTAARLDEIKTESGVPQDLAACHTAIIDDYVIEGHVPADVILRLLEEAPEVVGLAVAGMPMGSPGMEGPKPEPYDVMAIDREGTARVYDRR